MAAKQTHCYTCGKKFGPVKYECQVCGEWQCSDKCRQKHIETMDAIRLSPEDFQRFVEICNTPPEPTEELKKLMREKK